MSIAEAPPRTLTAPAPAATPATKPRWGAAMLSLGALGVVYGDIGTSPLYTLSLIHI